MTEYRDRYEHHLVLRVEIIQSTDRQFLKEYFAVAPGHSYFVCSEDEGRKAFLHVLRLQGGNSLS